METLLKKIEEINSLLKQFNPSPKGPKVPKPSLPATQHEVPNVKAPPTHKDPVKVAEQLKNPDLTQNKELLSDAKKNKGKLNINKRGQWSLNPKGKV